MTNGGWLVVPERGRGKRRNDRYIYIYRPNELAVPRESARKRGYPDCTTTQCNICVRVAFSCPKYVTFSFHRLIIKSCDQAATSIFPHFFRHGKPRPLLHLPLVVLLLQTASAKHLSLFSLHFWDCYHIYNASQDQWKGSKS